jgi:hypothetical protein
MSRQCFPQKSASDHSDDHNSTPDLSWGTLCPQADDFRTAFSMILMEISSMGAMSLEEVTYSE